MKRTIKIGIDVDGVLRDFAAQFAKYAKQRYDKTLKADDFTEFGFPNVTVRGRKIITDVFADLDAAEFVFGGAPTLTNAKTGYGMFTDDARFDVYIVSSQKQDHEWITNQWLERNGFDQHIRTFYERNKLKAPVQILIDDKPDHIAKYWQNSRDGILINAPYNTNGTVEQDFPRADDLIDAYTMLKNVYY